MKCDPCSVFRFGWFFRKDSDSNHFILDSMHLPMFEIFIESYYKQFFGLEGPLNLVWGGAKPPPSSSCGYRPAINVKKTSNMWLCPSLNNHVDSKKDSDSYSNHESFLTQMIRIRIRILFLSKNLDSYSNHFFPERIRIRIRIRIIFFWILPIPAVSRGYFATQGGGTMQNHVFLYSTEEFSVVW